MTHDNDDDDDWDVWEDDDWEDNEFLAKVSERLPGWHLMKMQNFNRSTFMQVEKWLKSNVKFGAYETLGWSAGCSYSVGVAFENGKDAMLCKLRWR